MMSCNAGCRLTSTPAKQAYVAGATSVCFDVVDIASFFVSALAALQRMMLGTECIWRGYTLMFAFLWAIIIGFIAGAIAKFIMPGRDPGGFIVTILLGIAGSVLAT